YALNMELANIPAKFEEHRWATEFRPIIGYKLDRWFFDINPILEWALSGDGLTIAPDFEPAGKVRYDTKKGFGVGFEYYAGLGPLNNIPSYKDEEHSLFIIADLLDVPSWEFNFGIG